MFSKTKMGKKGKNKNQTTNIQNAPKLEGENTEKDEKKQETVTEIPKVEIEALTEEGNESKEGTLKSKKRRNRKKKSKIFYIFVSHTSMEGYYNIPERHNVVVRARYGRNRDLSQRADKYYPLMIHIEYR